VEKNRVYVLRLVRRIQGAHSVHRSLELVNKPRDVEHERLPQLIGNLRLNHEMFCKQPMVQQRLYKINLLKYIQLLNQLNIMSIDDI
jgi:hypothetical protein